MRSLARPATLVLAIVFACPMARSQTVLYTFDGDSTQDAFGNSVSGAGDVNGDGFDDLIVGAAGDDNNGNSSGSARVFSGVDGSVLYTFEGDSWGDWFGASVSGAGDVNADGYADVIVGARGDDPNGENSGTAWVFSGVDGSTLYTFEGSAQGDSLGFSVGGAGDVNGDGHDDLIVGSPGDGVTGKVFVFSGVDGSVLYAFDGQGAGDLFGHSVGGAGDVNGDGYDDLVVGAPRDDNTGFNAGSARVLSGADGSALYRFDGDDEQDEFGYSVAGAGDVDGDGYDDVIVGAPSADHPGFASGEARVFSGVDGSVLYTFEGDSPQDQLGWSVGGAGDVDGDGYHDLIVGAPRAHGNAPVSGSAQVFSGADGSVLYTKYGDTLWDTLGESVSGAGDVNGDGFDDVIVGVPRDDNNNVPDRGSALVISVCDGVGTGYCSPSVANSSGQQAEIRACGSDVVADDLVSLSATGMPASQFGYFLNSQTQANTFPVPGSQGVLCLGGAIGRYSGHVLSTGAAGAFGIQLDLSHTPTPTGTVAIQAGETWNFTAWFRDLNPMQTSNFTDGVSVTFL